MTAKRLPLTEGNRFFHTIGCFQAVTGENFKKYPDLPLESMERRKTRFLFFPQSSMPDLSLLATLAGDSPALTPKSPSTIATQSQSLRTSRVDSIVARPSLPQNFARPIARAPIPKPRSGIQLYTQRLAALQSGYIHSRIPANSFETAWQNAVGQPTYEQWRKLLSSESRTIAQRNHRSPIAVMLGDSLSQWFPNDRLPAASTWLNQGISGETTRGILARSGDLANAQPHTIYVMAGVNDIKRGISDREIIQNLSQTLQRLRQRHPNAQIVLQSILPTRSPQIQNDRIAGLNQWLSVMAQRHGAYYLDVHQYFAARDGYLRSDLTTDGIHLNERGYGVWQSVLNQSEQYLVNAGTRGPIATR
jgi:lysophospholipase L1-like esterase